MLDFLGFRSLDELTDAAIPGDIRIPRKLELPAPMGEHAALAKLRTIMAENKVYASLIGMGYARSATPAVIQRNILENPGWYTAYTPYQAEIAQGRLEALLNYQTLVTDLTGMAIANASLLDEATAASEAMTLCLRQSKQGDDARDFLVSSGCHPQTIDVVRTRAEPLGIRVVVGDPRSWHPGPECFGVLVQYPASTGEMVELGSVIPAAHAAGALAVVACDLLALVALRAPGDFGADVVVGSSQRFGVPLGFGGPHAAFFATRDEFKRGMPGRLVGISKDAEGRSAYRLALQTREQHIRRDKATSNICTAQVLLAVMASMYAVYHGPDGLRRITGRIHRLTQVLAEGLRRLGLTVRNESAFFDTLHIGLKSGQAASVTQAAARRQINLRTIGDASIGITLDEVTTVEEIEDVWAAFHGGHPAPFSARAIEKTLGIGDQLGAFKREGEILTPPIFRKYPTETEMQRYIRRLEARDLSLTTAMIPLGSCTMKLNAATEMMPVTWPEVGGMHPFAPQDQCLGYAKLCGDLERWIAELTGLPGVSLQPNAGSAGEYAGLLAIRSFLSARGERQRDVCLIPVSAHGTNPASAIMAGFQVVPVQCDTFGNIDLADLRAKAKANAHRLAAIMVTYPSTHGVFETTIREITATVHESGGQVYMDGANLNAQVGLCRPGDYGVDVCHLNLHKTFCIPHGGGGPGVGPIAAAAHLQPHLPGHAVASISGRGSGAVSAAPYGSASILVIPWLYIAMLGIDGLTRSTQLAILNANYIARQLHPHFPVVYKGANDLVAHECILDFRPWKAQAGIEVEDVAKRLMDYGFHAPTMSWPVPGTMMVEPTESESKAELDRFCDAMIAIHAEMQAIASGEADRADNPLKNAPHTAQAVCADEWSRPYSRELAAYPAPWTREHKYWPPVARIDNVYGDRNLFCTCAAPSQRDS
jgi:glycine dehydrogenase